MSAAFCREPLHTVLEVNHSRALLDQLRHETKEHHQRLEDGLNLLRADLTLHVYRSILGRFYGFYRPWEDALGPLAARLLPDFPLRQQKLAKLIADLHYVGGLYVTEGATLGGQIISRHLRRAFGFPQGYGDTFFQSYGNKVGEMWISFCTVLARHSSPTVDPQIIRAAQLTFEALDKWFNEVI